MLSTLRVCIGQRFSELFLNSRTKGNLLQYIFPLSFTCRIPERKDAFHQVYNFHGCLAIFWTRTFSQPDFTCWCVRPSVLSSKTYGEKEETDIIETCKTYWSWTPCHPSSHHKDNVFLWMVSMYSCRNVPNASMNNPSSSPSFGPFSYLYLLQPSASFVHWYHSRYLSGWLSYPLWISQFHFLGTAQLMLLFRCYRSFFLLQMYFEISDLQQ